MFQKNIQYYFNVAMDLNRKSTLAINQLLRSIGLDIYRYRQGFHYVPNYYGRSAQKQIDIRRIPEFGDLATSAIQLGKTSLYYDRLLTFFDALKFISKRASITRGDTNVAEVGVYKGGTSHFILSAGRALGISKLNLYAFDTFQGHSEFDVIPDVDADQRPGQFSDTRYEAVKELLSAFENVHLFKGRIQETIADVPPLIFQLVHLDVDLYEPTSFGLKYFDQHMERGSVVIVDDYGFVTCAGVKKAVDEFASIHPEYLSIFLQSGQCLLLKT